MDYPTAYNNWMIKNPEQNSLVYNNKGMNISPAPPGHSFIITEGGDFVITETGDRTITE